MDNGSEAPTIVGRQEAQERGLKQYFTGKPCKYGHIDWRFVSSRKCLACHRSFNSEIFARRSKMDPEYRIRHDEKAREWKQKNPEKCLAHGQLWRENNLEKSRALSNQWHAANRHKLRPSERAWKAANPDRVKAITQRWKASDPLGFAIVRRAIKTNRRAREKSVGDGRSSKQDIQRLFDEQDGHCACCGTVPDRLEIDHIMPVLLLGSSNPENLQLLCLPCNRSKSGLHPDEWRRRLRSRAIVPRLPELQL